MLDCVVDCCCEILVLFCGVINQTANIWQFRRESRFGELNNIDSPTSHAPVVPKNIQLVFFRIQETVSSILKLGIYRLAAWGTIIESNDRAITFLPPNGERKHWGQWGGTKRTIDMRLVTTMALLCPVSLTVLGKSNKHKKMALSSWSGSTTTKSRLERTRMSWLHPSYPPPAKRKTQRRERDGKRNSAGIEMAFVWLQILSKDDGRSRKDGYSWKRQIDADQTRIEQW